MNRLIALLASAFLHIPILAQPPPDTLRVMSWNIRHGLGTDGRIDLERVAATIVRVNPDVVLLQEVDRGCARSGGADQALELGRLTGLHHAFGKAMDHDGGEYGLAILSRQPLEAPEVRTLPGNGEPRVVFSGTLDSSIGWITVATTHLDHQHRKRQFVQAQVAADTLREMSGPVVLGGDFNAAPGSRTIRVFQQAPWSVLEKKPDANVPPEADVDHIMLRGVLGDVTEVIDETLASDHRPLVTTVRAAE